MKRPTVASLKKVNAENLAGLGAARLAEILVSVAATRPELKRRLRMELAAEHGAEHLAVEIDRRLASLESSRGKIGWRQRPSFIRDLDTLRVLIADRLAALDAVGARERLWMFIDLTGRVNTRLRDRDGELGLVFARAAGDLGGLLQAEESEAAAAALLSALARNPAGWAGWLPQLLARVSPAMAAAALRQGEASPTASAWAPLVRQLADAAGDVDAYAASFTAQALKAPATAAQVAARLLAAGRVEEAGALLTAAKPRLGRAGGWLGTASAVVDLDHDWESAWIDYLERAGQGEAAQAARWAGFERTLSVERARAFVSRLDDFDDVEAESRAVAYAARHPDLAAGLAFLIEWPALLAAAEMIATRADEIDVGGEQAELWAGKLRGRYPAAAEQLLRRAAAAAFRRRDFKTCDRLTEEADALAP